MSAVLRVRCSLDDAIRLRLIRRGVDVLGYCQASKLSEEKRSVVMVSGQPNCEIQCATSAAATVSALMLVRGTATGHLVKRSIIMKK